MPDVTVGANEVSSGRITLVAGQVSTVTFGWAVRDVEVYSDGTAAAYFTVDGTAPTVDGRNCFELPAGTASIYERHFADTTNHVVKLISAGTPVVRVQAA